MGIQLKGQFDAISFFHNSEDLYLTIIEIIKTLPIYQFVLVLLIVAMIAFYATSFDSINHITKVVLNASGWSNKEQTKSVPGMKSTSYPVWYFDGTPTIAQYEAASIRTLMTCI